MRAINPIDLSVSRRHHLLLSAIGPRPIAFVSTISAGGQVNLSPYSFFNLFSTHPPIGAFCVALRGRDSSMKDTLLNIQEVPEMTINVVSYAMVEQQNLASYEFERGVNEFDKAGFTMAESKMVSPPFVKESPVALEGELRQVINFGTEGPAGNMVLFDIKLIHVHEEYLDHDNRLDCTRLDLVGRMGGNWYCRAQGEALFEVDKPLGKNAIGIDRLPDAIRKSEVLSANDLGKLGSTMSIPTIEEIESYSFQKTALTSVQSIHKRIKSLILHNDMRQAAALAFWKPSP